MDCNKYQKQRDLRFDGKMTHTSSIKIIGYFNFNAIIAPSIKNKYNKYSKSERARKQVKVKVRSPLL